MTIYAPVNVTVKNIQEPNRLAVAAEALMRVSCMDLNFTAAIVDSKLDLKQLPFPGGSLVLSAITAGASDVVSPT